MTFSEHVDITSVLRNSCWKSVQQSHRVLIRKSDLVGDFVNNTRIHIIQELKEPEFEKWVNYWKAAFFQAMVWPHLYLDAAK